MENEIGRGLTQRQERLKAKGVHWGVVRDTEGGAEDGWSLPKTQHPGT